MGRSEAATCPEKVIHSMASTVVRSPTRERRTPGYTFWTPRMVPNPRIYSPDPQGWSRTPTCASWTPGMGSGPSVWGPGHPQWGPKVPGQNVHGPWAGPRRGSDADTCPGPVWCRPVRIRLCSPPRRRPDAATWPTTRDVSQRAEPDVRPPGYATPTFIADKARCLPTPLTCDVPPRHLMSHVHPVGGVPVHSTGRRCAASAFNETCPSHRRHACPFHWQTARPYCRVHYAHHYSYVTKEAAASCQRCACCGQHGPGDCTYDTCISCSRYSICYVPRPTCRGSATLYVPPLSYKREGTRRYKASPLKPT
jgi:hypothetical protein